MGSASGSVFLEDDPDRNLDPDFMTDFMTIFSVREHISKTNDQIYLNFLQKVGCTRGSVLLEDDPDLNPDPDFMTIFCNRRGFVISDCCILFSIDLEVYKDIVIIF